MSTPITPAPASTATLASFEESIARLTRIVERLEEGELTLEESLQLFEEGIKLSRVSQERLDRAQKRVEKLLRGQLAKGGERVGVQIILGELGAVLCCLIFGAHGERVAGECAAAFSDRFVE